MRNVEPVLEHKMDEAVTHYINSHQPPESVHVDANSLALNEDDSGDRVVTIMHPPNFTTQMCRQISAGDQVGEGPWVEELLDPEGRLAAIVAHLAQHSRTQHQHLHKVPIRSELDSSVILDTPMRLYNGQTMHEHSPEPIVVQVPSLPPLPPLQEMKRCPETDWLIKDKDELKDQQLLSQDAVLEASASPAHKQSKKSLPHKKRISRKLKRTTNSTPQQDIVVINCGSEVAQEEILPDSYAHGHDSHDTSNVHDAHGVHGPHDPHNSVLPEPHHIGQEINMRSLFVCQLCGEFYGHEQLKFYQHLKHHYEPQLVLDHPDLPIDKVRPYSTYYSSTVTSSSSSSSTEAQHLMHAPDLPINKMTNTCIDNVATLPDSIVELSLENTVPRIIYPPPDKAFSSYKIPFNPSNMEKEQEGRVDLFDSLDKLEMYFCTKCSKSFRKQKQCEIHIKEVHLNQRLDDISEFSDPEDLMEGIHVAVEDGGGDGEGGGEGSEEHYDQALLPHLTVENGQVHQEHVRHWYLRNGSNSVPLCTCGGAGYCAMCTDAHAPNIPPTQTIHTQTVHTQSPNVPLPSVTSVSHVTTSHVTNVTTVSHTSNATVSQNATPSQRTDKDESLQRIFETDDHSQEDYTENIPEQRSLRIKVEKPVAEKVEKKKSTKTFECSHCDRVFRHRNSLFYHALMHSEKQHVCKECGKEFYTVNALKIHKRVHTDDRPCKCEECGKTFRQYSDLRYHKASLHSDKKNYKCDFCGKEFARRYSLNLHRRIHTGEKNYKCEYCNKSFRASCYRLSHMRTHTGTKPHKCTQCEKSFRVAYDLRRHMQIHDKVRVRGDEQKNKTKEKKQSVKVQQQTKVKEQQQTKVKETKPEAAQSPHDKKETRSSILKSLLDKKSKPPKIPPKKAPNVTVQNRADDQFKIDTEYNNEAFDTRQDQYKFKVYCTGELKQKEFVESIRLEERAVDRELATLRSLKNHQICDIEGNKIHFARENTDGKMQVYTQIEKTKEYNGPIVTNTVSLSDIRSIDRDVRDPRNEIHGETIDSALLERLSAYYNNNIPAV